jgi:hypothetical protein
MRSKCFVAVTGEYGIVIRRRALAERNLSYQSLLAAMEADEPHGADEELLTFGPSFGKEALQLFTQKLVSLGFVYFDDFFEFQTDHPRWCKFAVAWVP